MCVRASITWARLPIYTTHLVVEARNPSISRFAMVHTCKTSPIRCQLIGLPFTHEQLLLCLMSGRQLLTLGAGRSLVLLVGGREWVFRVPYRPGDTISTTISTEVGTTVSTAASTAVSTTLSIAVSNTVSTDTGANEPYKSCEV